MREQVRIDQLRGPHWHRWNDLPTTAFGVSGATCWRGDLTRLSPVDRGRLASKHHVITDAAGIP